MAYLVLWFINILPCLEDTIIINKWLYLGPFSIGMREGIVGVDEKIESIDFQPDTAVSYPSILVQGSKVRWFKVQSEEGYVKIKYQNVLWDTIQDYYGAAGILSMTYFYGQFEIKGERRGLIHAQGVSTFHLNGKTFPGDVYRDGYAMVPVILKDGKNSILVKTTGNSEQEFGLKVLPATEPIMIIKKDITCPDFIKDERINSYIGIPIMNTTENRLLNGIITISGKGLKKVESSMLGIMPFSVLKIPLRLESQETIKEDDSLLINIIISFGEFIVSDSCWIKVKEKNKSFVRTFLSRVDNSCQYYTVLPPDDFNAESTYALIFSLHGAGVEARGQVGAYSQKDWAFIVAPTNRRRFGFDWQDWGRLDFLEVLADVKKNFKIDTNRIYLTGHSMGGHGVWHIGLSHPDLFAAIAPSAGWTSFQLYVPYFLQKSYLFAEPEQIKFRDMVLREDITPLFLENALNLPIYILHGGLDDNVPPIQARIFNKYLSDLNYNFIYNEVEGKKHWWDIDTTPGVDCVDLKRMMQFLRSKTRKPYTKHVVFKTCDIAHANQCYWVRIDELEDIYQDAIVEAKIDSNVWFVDPTIGSGGCFTVYNIVIKLSNINRFTISLNNNLVLSGTVKFIINNQEIKIEYKETHEISFYKSGDKFKMCKLIEKGLRKTKNLYGPIKRAYFEPFLLVYGTTGDSITTENNFHQARVQSYTWWIRANGFVEIIPDTEVTTGHIKNYNLILFGNAETNSIIKTINKKLPIHFNEDYKSLGEHIKDVSQYENCLFIGKDPVEQKDLCLIEIYPNPLNPDKFVLLYSPTTKKAGRYIGLFSTLYSGAGLPDFIIWDKSAYYYGWGGVVVTGFFDKNWRFNKNLSFSKL